MAGRKDKYTSESAQDVKEWIETLLNESLGDRDPVERLKDGVLLCRLVNAIHPKSANFKVSKMPFVQMENIAAFLRAAESLGVPHYELFETVDLYEMKDPVQVLITIRSLSRHAHQKNPDIPVLGPKLVQPTLRKAPFKKDTEAASWNVNQYGYMKGASQSTEGVIIGGAHHIVSPSERHRSMGSRVSSSGSVSSNCSTPAKKETASPRVGGKINFTLGRATRGVTAPREHSEVENEQSQESRDLESKQTKNSESKEDDEEKKESEGSGREPENLPIFGEPIAEPKLPVPIPDFDFNDHSSQEKQRPRYAELQSPTETRYAQRKRSSESYNSPPQPQLAVSPSYPIKTMTLDLDNCNLYSSTAQSPLRSPGNSPQVSPSCLPQSAQNSPSRPPRSPQPPPKPLGLSLRPSARPKGPRELMTSPKINTPSVFGHDSDDEQNNGKNFLQSQRNQVNAQLVAHVGKSSSLKVEDPSIYQYDEVYDSMKAGEKLLRAKSSDDGKTPKYVDKLLESKGVRERDKLRARDILLKREREAEGGQYSDKEMFVTTAYKKQQEEIQWQEEEDEKKVENKTGMKDFYRNVLDCDELSHEVIVSATSEIVHTSNDEKDNGEDLRIAERARQLNSDVGYERVQINDDGQVVDERQLLSAGLNIVRKPAAGKPDLAITGRLRSTAFSSRKPKFRSREQQTGEIMSQIQQDVQKRALEEEKKKRELIEHSKSRKTEDAISSAKERYLARKREAEQASLRRKAAS